ncbi:hypothetical protein ACWKWZ_05080 [Metapseudomonas otitidis]|uniref:hypothetical protein n=1 Tax=Metapseudomonas otitidis TaxID=319939 RepID=UPI002637A682|nr:hypothetical protein [Pseudomonas otitidis]
MDIQSRTQLLRALIDQLSEENPRDARHLDGDPQRVLIGLRDLNELGLICAQLDWSESCDAQGLLLADARAITLTRRGVAFRQG